MQVSIIILAQQLQLLKSCLASIELFTEWTKEIAFAAEWDTDAVTAILTAT